MALPDHQVTEAASADLAARVQRAAETRGYGGVKRGTDIRGDNYDSGDAGWRQYVRQVVDGLREVAGDNEQRLGRAIGDLRKAEEQSFAAWLRATVFGGWLSASGGSEPLPTADVLQRLDRLEQDAEAFAARFGNDGLFPGDTVDDADRLRNRREEKFDTPDPRSAEPTRTERWLALGAAAAFFVIGGWAAWEIAEAIPQFAGGFSRMIPWIVVIAGSVGARWLTLWLLLRGRAEAAKPAVARRDAEDALFRACEHRDRVLALRWPPPGVARRAGGGAVLRGVPGGDPIGAGGGAPPRRDLQGPAGPGRRRGPRRRRAARARPRGGRRLPRRRSRHGRADPPAAAEAYQGGAGRRGLARASGACQRRRPEPVRSGRRRRGGSAAGAGGREPGRHGRCREGAGALGAGGLGPRPVAARRASARRFPPSPAALRKPGRLRRAAGPRLEAGEPRAAQGALGRTPLLRRSAGAPPGVRGQHGDPRTPQRGADGAGQRAAGNAGSLRAPAARRAPRSASRSCSSTSGPTRAAHLGRRR